MNALQEHQAANVRRNELMSQHTSWRVGGPADVFFRPESREELSAFLGALSADEEVIWVGLGSNLLVRDGGIRGVVIATHGALSRIERLNETHVYAEAGVACAKLAKLCASWQLGPATFFAGIPGTVGGALAMNAGAFGGETWAHVTEVETIDREGRFQIRQAGEYQIGYRTVKAPKDEWFISATFHFERDRSLDETAIRDLLSRRKASQPIGLPSCGSVFRNPAGDHAARLIEAAGLKGFCIGGACVSEKHANFIINHDDATAADVEALIRHIQQRVQQEYGIRLVPEVRVVGVPR